MTATFTDCVTGCGTPGGGYFLCRGCTRTLLASLRDVPTLVSLLDDTIARRTRDGTGEVGVASRSAETPLPVNLTASEVARDLDNVLTTWARDLAERTGRPLPVTGETPVVAAWLVSSLVVIRTHPAADEALDEITDSIARAWRAVDRPPAAAYCGPCDHCGEDLYARMQAAVLRCAHCEAEYDTAERRHWLLEQTRDQLVTAAEAARALPALLGHVVTPSMIRGYAHRGRLASRPGLPGHPRYRVGDLIDVLSASA